MGARTQRKTVPPAAKATKPIAHGPTWTSERVEELKTFIGAGLSCSQIAARIGVSRNAVIGKMNRLGLSRPRDTLAKALALVEVNPGSPADLEPYLREQADILLRQKLISAIPDWKKALRPDLWAKASA